MNFVRAAALVACLLAGLAPACNSRSRAPQGRVRVYFWHAFGAQETEALNQALATWTARDVVEVVPIRETFARGKIMLGRSLQSDATCPDLARIDATWLPGLVRAGELAPVPAEVAAEAARSRHWLPEAAALASLDSRHYGLPQAIDGLALIHRRAAIDQAELPWPPRTMSELVEHARRLTGEGRYGLGIRVDGYWFVAFLRQWGGAMVDPASGKLGIDTPAAVAVLERFAGLFGTVAPPPPPSGTATEEEERRFRDGTLPIVINGPWAMAGLTGGNIEGIGVAALPGAPMGGQILVVPRCARYPGEAWKLAAHLTAPELQAEWARRLGVIPTSTEGLELAGGFAREFYQALRTAEPLPRHPVTPELFDDLTPAVAAVVARDARARDALAGVARAWSRLLTRHGVAPVPYAGDAAPDAARTAATDGGMAQVPHTPDTPGRAGAHAP